MDKPAQDPLRPFSRRTRIISTVIGGGLMAVAAFLTTSFAVQNVSNIGITNASAALQVYHHEVRQFHEESGRYPVSMSEIDETPPGLVSTQPLPSFPTPHDYVISPTKKGVRLTWLGRDRKPGGYWLDADRTLDQFDPPEADLTLWILLTDREFRSSWIVGALSGLLGALLTWRELSVIPATADGCSATIVKLGMWAGLYCGVAYISALMHLIPPDHH